MQTRHLVIAAAGTGGHVMPGIAVAKEMERKGWSVSWLGTNAGMERRLVERVGITCDTVNFSGLRGKDIAHAVTGAFKLIGAYFKAVSLLKRTKANALFTTGGYIAVPSVLAAKTLGLPVFVMNCDADVLMSVRAVMPFAKRVFCGFEGAAARLAKDKAVVTGNPVRKEILSVPNATERLAGRTGSLRILVFGGSLGARVLNETVPKALAMFEPGKRPSVVHQCGAKNLESTRAAYDTQGVMATIEPFIDDMA
ncbi:MAG TPA: UDP-N-acetylglucosamine--N-acetylmuramyl-(pentapeptide) pyrophosphoryl-undecaprenol N-acetylglucosamine transferase, partial [Sutterella sp.]|nr:UDP-N-acetylglucosamine--N-acetylmuramyl-(pentapeptide) pyrophosphoryl-undecaprenol N-acetylglucosamine transferase [Sutterella sp.]